jgi:hypothetical protein
MARVNSKHSRVVYAAIEFEASTNLDWALKNFITPSARQRFGADVMKLRTSYLSPHVLIGANSLSDSQRVEFDRLQSSLDQAYNHEYRLESSVSNNMSHEGLSIALQLRLQARERNVLVAEPVFPFEYMLPIDIYTVLSTDDLLGEGGRKVALNSLNRHLGIRDGKSDPEGAPWTTFVTHPKLSYVWPYEHAPESEYDLIQ